MSEEITDKQIDLHTEEVQEILGHVPHWIIRWGIVVIFIAILAFFTGSWFFKYPDIVTASIIVTTENPPASIIARTNGKIEVLLVQDNQKVEEEELLAVIKNPADYKAVLALKKVLPNYNNVNYLSTHRASSLDEQNMGEIQSFYSSFIKRYDDYANFLKLNYHGKKIEAVTQQIEKVKVYFVRLSEQKKILERDLTIGQQQYSRDSVLHENKVIPNAEFEKAESVFLQKKYAFETTKATLANTEIQLSQLEQTILDLQLQFADQKNKLELEFKESSDNLNSQLASWENNYLLKAPVAGIITFTNYWSQNQNVKAGDAVFTVVPESITQIIGRVTLPIGGSGKVRKGQSVNIKFGSYPYMEYGMVRGVIKSISLVPSDNNYSAEVIFPEGLISTYGKELKFNQEMQGSAEIITDDLRLLERIIQPIKSALKNNAN